MNDIGCKDTSQGAKLSITPLGINEIQTLRPILLYPNPSNNGGFTVDLSSLAGKADQIIIQNPQGQLVLTQRIESPKI
jgi:hypothetical protein